MELGHHRISEKWESNQSNVMIHDVRAHGHIRSRRSLEILAVDANMPIDQTCKCGAKLRVKDAFSGREIKCPRCSETMVIRKPKVAEEVISVRCQCGKAFQAKVSMAGKNFSCTACHQPVSIPKPSQVTLDTVPTFESELPSSNLSTFFDESIPHFGLPTAPHVPYQAPMVHSNFGESGTSKKPLAKKLPSKGMAFAPNFNQEPLVLITAIFCILFGLGRVMVFGGLGLLLSSGAFLSIGGLIYIANTLICLGILAAGVGILFEQDWAVNVGQIAASMYFVMVMVNAAIFLGSIGLLAESDATALGGVVIRYFSFLIGESVAPGLLLYVTFRDNS